MVLFVVSLSKVALPAVANLANDGQLVARRFNTLARHGGWKNLMDRVGKQPFLHTFSTMDNFQQDMPTNTLNVRQLLSIDTCIHLFLFSHYIVTFRKSTKLD